MLLNEVISLSKSLNLSLVDYGQVDGGNQFDSRKKQFLNYVSDEEDISLYCEYKVSKNFDGNNNLLYVKTVKICNTMVIEKGKVSVDLADILCLANDLGLVISDYGHRSKRHLNVAVQYATYISEDSENKTKIYYEHDDELRLFTLKINSTPIIETDNKLDLSTDCTNFESIRSKSDGIKAELAVILEVKIKDLLTKSEYRVPIGAYKDHEDAHKGIDEILRVLNLSVFGRVVKRTKNTVVFRCENLVYTIYARSKRAYSTFELGVDETASVAFLPTAERNIECNGQYVPKTVHDSKKHHNFAFKAECVAFLLLNNNNYKLTCSQFNVSDSTLWNWVKNYKQEGILGLVTKYPGVYDRKYTRPVNNVDDALTYKSFRIEMDKDELSTLKDKKGNPM